VAKDTPRIADGELQRLLESWGSESLKINQTTPTSPYVVYEGFKKNLSRSYKNKLQHIQLSDWNFKKDRILWSDKIKRGFLSANPDMFGANRGKK